MVSLPVIMTLALDSMSDGIPHEIGDDQPPAQPAPPWFKDRAGPHPFSLVQKIASDDPTSTPFRSVALFPWSFDSLATLWGGRLNTPENLLGWKDMISEFSGSIAAGQDGAMRVISLRMACKNSSVKLPHDPACVKSVAWAICEANHLEPLVIFSGSCVLYIFNVKKRRIVSYLRGHGGPITSIVVHPLYPQIVCTTSNDFSSRIYDLALTPADKPNNPHWPPLNTPSLAGAAHGLQTTEIEGTGIGRCVLVLMGGRSGGHRAAVLGAAFHTALPLIATCGLDRVVKIWHFPEVDGQSIAREDKPLFSSSRIHKSRVLSVAWLSHDILLTHSAPAIMRVQPDVHDELYLEDGTLIVWRWLGMDRFFPPNQPTQAILRGCASDYQESSSFKLISISSLPTIPTEHQTISTSPGLHVYQSCFYDPLVLFVNVDSKTLCMLNVTNLPVRRPPPFPHDDDDVAELTTRMRLDDDDPNARSLIDQPPPVTGWRLGNNNSTQAKTANVQISDADELMACTMGMEGRMIVAVGSHGTVWVWLNTETSP